MLQARLAYFYHWSWKDLEEIPVIEAYRYYEAITKIDAQERLVDLNIVAYPHMKDDDRKGLHRKIFELAYPEKKGENVLTTDQMARMFNGR